jgi:hypothetical protein
LFATSPELHPAIAEVVATTTGIAAATIRPANRRPNLCKACDIERPFLLADLAASSLNQPAHRPPGAVPIIVHDFTWSDKWQPQAQCRNFEEWKVAADRRMQRPHTIWTLVADAVLDNIRTLAIALVSTFPDTLNVSAVSDFIDTTGVGLAHGVVSVRGIFKPAAYVSQPAS